MRKLQVWSLILWITNGNDEVESFPLAARETRRYGCRQQHRKRASEVIQQGLDPLLSINSISRAGGLSSLSSVEESSVSTSDFEGGNSATSKNNGNVSIRLTIRGIKFERTEQWLEDATKSIFDLKVLPLGSLAKDDVVAITDLMVAWSQRRSLDAALEVERLLKRVVDDMNVGNGDVHVSTYMYMVAMEAWGKSGEAAGAERAQTIHDAIIQTYQQTEDRLIRPTTKTYNTLTLAWARSKNPSAIDNAETVFRDMLTASDGTVRPDAETIAIMLDLYARNNSKESISKAETLVKSMHALKIEKNHYVYSALQDVYLKSGLKDAPKKTMDVLRRMIHAYAQDDTMTRPTVTNFNNVLRAYSRTPSRVSALGAEVLLNRMELSKEDGGYDVDADRMSYCFAILTCARCPNFTLAANMAEPILERMEKLSKVEAKRRKELSITNPPLMFVDKECFNVVLVALSKSRDSDAVDRIFSIISRMEEYANEGQEHLRPNARSMNTALHRLSHARNNDAVQRAEQTLDRMLQMHTNGVADMRPDGFSFTPMLRCYQRLGTLEAAQKSNEIILRMEELYEKGILDKPPDRHHYTIVCSTWSLSRSKIAPQKCLEILSHMKEKDKEGWPKVTPNTITYNAILGECSGSIARIPRNCL